MRRYWTFAFSSLTAIIVFIGCSSTPARQSTAFVPSRTLGRQVAAQPSAQEEPVALARDTSTLPEPPWAETALPSDQVPAPLLTAWSRAENRNQCPPIAPRDLAEGAGARARASDFEGGWAVEYDRRGAPGLSRDGEACARCGRGVFGIAATSLTPEDLVEETSEADTPEPSFADGSFVRVEPAAQGEQVAAATLMVGSGGCVYQVWSFLGEEHVRRLVGELRMVDVSSGPARVAAR